MRATEGSVRMTVEAENGQESFLVMEIALKAAESTFICKAV